MADITDMIMQYSQQYKSPITAGLEGVLLGRELRQKKMQSELDNRIKKFEMERAKKLLPYEERTAAARATQEEGLAEYIKPKLQAEISEKDADAKLKRFKAENPEWKFMDSGGNIIAFNPANPDEYKDTGIPSQQAPQVLIKEMGKGLGEILVSDYQKTMQSGTRLGEINYMIDQVESGKVSKTGLLAKPQVAASQIIEAFGYDPKEVLGKLGIENVQDYETFNAMAEKFPLDVLAEITLTPVSDADIALARGLGASIDKTSEANLFLLKLARAGKSTEQALSPYLDRIMTTNMEDPTAKRDYYQAKRLFTSAPKVHKTKDGKVLYFDTFMSAYKNQYNIDPSTIEGLSEITDDWNKVVKGM